jgi:alkanesulfonate monooxygenase SsuD/methylene tetrahydromethanopterin reductase-like flavin-dependent oxidoreductase (luciferase family)
MDRHTNVAHPWVSGNGQGVRFGIETAVLPDWGATRDFVQTVEGLGFDSLWIPDHPVAAGSATWTSLAAIAGATRTIRLGPLVSCAYYLNPVLLARSAADVDRISGGRLVLGLGSGDMPWEFNFMGLEYPPVAERQAVLEEQLQVIPPLLRGETVTYSGKHVQVNGTALAPPASQQPHVPILVAGGGERTTLRFVAQYADACNLGAATWAGHAYTPEDGWRKLDVLRQRCAEVGRPFESVLRTALSGVFLAESAAAVQAKLSVLPPELVGFLEQIPLLGSPQEVVPRVRALLTAGFQYIVFIVLSFDLESLNLLAQQVLPAVVHGQLSRAAVSSL